MAEWSVRAAVCGKRVMATAVGLFNVTPRQLWDILTLPEGAVIFRVEGRQLLSNDGLGKWEEHVVFTAPVRILFWKPTTRTRVHQYIDASDPQCITVDFILLQSDLMSHLQGHWELKQLSPEQPGSPPVTQVTYTFQMWPKGVPAALRFMPGLLDAVKGAVKREAAQLLDKVYYVSQKVRPGVTALDAVKQAAAEVQLSGGSFKLLQQALAAASSTTSSSTNVPCSDKGSTAAAVSLTAAAGTVAGSNVICHQLSFGSDIQSVTSDDDLISADVDPAAVAAALSGSDSSRHNTLLGRVVLAADDKAAANVVMRMDTNGSADQCSTVTRDSLELSSDVDADVVVESSTDPLALAPKAVPASTAAAVTAQA